MAHLIPITVVVVTKNEAERIQACLLALKDFGQIIVVDSQSDDDTQALAKKHGAEVRDFQWNGRYPKKRQWCLDHLKFKYDWVFFVDADEIVTPNLVVELRVVEFGDRCAGYFVRGQYVFQGRVLKFGLKNNKLALINRHKMEFPVVDDLDIEGMWEIEGHYQPVLKDGFQGLRIGQLSSPLLHYAYEDADSWRSRHERYARWETMMNRRYAWPDENSGYRSVLKHVFRALPFRDVIAFLHCYVLKFGFLDGVAGYHFAKSRYRYYRMISDYSAKI